jgi:hypothetical protein
MVGVSAELMADAEADVVVVMLQRITKSRKHKEAIMMCLVKVSIPRQLSVHKREISRSQKKKSVGK